MGIATTRRIAQVIVGALDLSSPPCTLAELGGGGGAAAGTIRMWCRALEVQARDVVWFARGFWVVYWAKTLDGAPNDLLQFAERRTTAHYIGRSGSLGQRSDVVSIDTYCARQTFVAHHQILSDVIYLAAARTGAGPKTP